MKLLYLTIVVYSMLVSIGRVHGYLRYMQDMPNAGLVARNGVLWPAVGHTHPTMQVPGHPPADDEDAPGGNLGGENPFGIDFEDIGGNQWTVALCQRDSDGDGFSNGEELGDPDCKWTRGGTSTLRPYDISHPGYADSVPSGTMPPPTPNPPTVAAVQNATAVQSATRTVGKMSYSWTIVKLDTNPTLEITMSTTQNVYVSWGIAPTQMSGPMLACYMAPGAANAQCSEWAGVGLSLGTRKTSSHTIISASSNGGGYTVKVQLPVSAVNGANTAQRFIWATGSYQTSTNEPLLHTTTDRGADSNLNLFSVVTFGNGVTAVPSTPLPTTGVPPTPPPATIAAGASATRSTTQTVGKMSYSWTMANLASPKPEIELTMSTTTQNVYVSWGVAPSLMNGPMIACYLAPGSAAAQCSEWQGVALTLGSRRTSTHTIQSASSNAGGGFTITVRIPAADMSAFNMAQRHIWATGSYQTSTNEPLLHTTTDRGEVLGLNVFSVVTGAGALPTAPPSTAVPTLAQVSVDRSTQVVKSGSFSVMAGTMSFDWTLFGAGTVQARHFAAQQQTSAPTSSGAVVEMTMVSSGDYYVSFGISPSLMNGPMIACYVDPATGVPHCSDWMGVALDIFPMQQFSRIVNSSRTGSQFSVTIRAFASDMGVTLGKWQRSIVAIGPYSVAGNAPKQHTVAGRDELPVNIETGEALTSPYRGHFWIAVSITIAVCLIMLIVGAIINFRKMLIPPNASLAMVIGGIAAFVVLFILFVVMNYLDYRRNLKAQPEARALGDGALFCLWFVLYPVPKHIGLSTIVGTSYERLITYHNILGTTITVMASLHFIVIAAQRFTSFGEIFVWDGKNPALAGFIAWLCFVIVTLSSWTLRRVAYTIFLWCHFLFIPAIVFSILHYPKLLFALIPPLLNYLVDWILRGVSWYRANPSVFYAAVHPMKNEGDEALIVLTLRTRAHCPVPEPGGFVKLSFPSVGLINPHPFSVCHFDDKREEATFVIKDLGMWTKSLRRAVEEKTLTSGTSAVWNGPYGALQQPMGKSDHVLLVGGGIGVTPMVHIASCMANPESAEYRIVAEKTQTVTLIWIVKSLREYECVMPYLQQTFAQVGDEHAIKTNLVIYETFKKKGKTGAQEGEEDPSPVPAFAQTDYPMPHYTEYANQKKIEKMQRALSTSESRRLAPTCPLNFSSTQGDDEQGVALDVIMKTSSSSVLPEWFEMRSGRPDFATVMKDLFPNDDESVSMYCCGPDPMMKSCLEAAASRSGPTYTHSETFEF